LDREESLTNAPPYFAGHESQGEDLEKTFLGGPQSREETPSPGFTEALSKRSQQKEVNNNTYGKRGTKKKNLQEVGKDLGIAERGMALTRNRRLNLLLGKVGR